jgi:N6-L-threonylcarbamoyladenine synthase
MISETEEKPQLVLGIESSCDETSASVVEDGVRIRSLVVASQSEIHARHHGVVPEVASRAHVEQILPVVQRALQEAHIDPSEPGSTGLTGVAVTNRPGLTGSLAVGLSFAKAYALAAGLPFVAVDHMAAHAYAALLVDPDEEPLAYPYIVVLVSGGHTIIAVSHAYDQLEVLGTTVDDACGEAYDKISAFLGTGYPGGPVIDRLARAGDPRCCTLPRPKLNRNDNRYDFSYSGLKTAVVHQLDRFWNGDYPRTRENIAAAFQRAAIGMIVDRVRNAMEDTGIRRFTAGGGVASNSYLREKLHELIDTSVDARLVLPPPVLCVDNAAMVAGLGHCFLRDRRTSGWDTGVTARVDHFRRSGRPKH